MNVYGELTAAQLENLTADPTLASAKKGRLWYRTDLSTLKVDLGGSADTLALLAATQTFSGKSFSDAVKMAQIASPSAPSSGFTSFYAKADGELYRIPNGGSEMQVGALINAATTYKQIATPSSPSAGFNKIYPKSDNNFYTLTSAGSEAKILTSLNAFTAPTVQKFTATGTTTGYLFTISTSSTVAVGDTYTNNGNTYTVLAALTSQTGQVLFMSGASAPTAPGTALVRATGAGTASISFTASTALATCTIAANALYLRVRLVGGGGGGGPSGSSVVAAGAGTPSIFGDALVIVGNGGAPGNSNSNAGAGGSASVGGASGVAFTGGGGGPGPFDGGGTGGNSIFGGGGIGGSSINGGNAATNSGSGGGGGGTNSATGGGGGGAGGGADVIITSPAATYVYCVGTGGPGGTASTTNGGNGAAGIIELTEYYQ